MYFFVFYANNLCFKWIFKQGVLTKRICPKWGDFMPGKVDTSVLDCELKLYLLTWSLNIISWKLYVTVWVGGDHYHSFKMVQKVFGGVFKKEDIFKKTDKLSVLLNYVPIIWLYRLFFELCCVWWNQMAMSLC